VSHDSQVQRVAVLRDYPLRLWLEQNEHLDSMLREFHLLLLGADADDAMHTAAPGRLVQVAGELVGQYGGLLQTVNDERQRAVEQGLDRIDSRVPLVDGLPAALEHVRDVLEEIDDSCRRGDLLLLPRSPELVAFGTWTGTELIAQYGGAAPTPWSGRF
jgi:hypothetical protein